MTRNENQYWNDVVSAAHLVEQANAVIKQLGRTHRISPSSLPIIKFCEEKNSHFMYYDKSGLKDEELESWNNLMKNILVHSGYTKYLKKRPILVIELFYLVEKNVIKLANQGLFKPESLQDKIKNNEESQSKDEVKQIAGNSLI